MKKISLVLLLVLAINMILTSCNKTTEKKEGLKVVTSFYTMYDFASKIAGDKAEVTNIMPAGTEAHHWEPSTKDMQILESADIIVYNGAGMESWVDKVKDSLSSQNITFLETTSNLPLSDKSDPHVWLDPNMAKAQMESIYKAMSDLDPANKDYYEQNFKKYSLEFDKLHEAYIQESSNFTKHEIIVAHEAYGYLCSAYGITQLGIDGLSSDNEPSPVRMAKIVEFGKENDVSYIFYDEMESKKTAETIAEELGIKTDILTAIEGLSEENEKNGDDYFTLMYSNLDKLKEALK